VALAPVAGFAGANPVTARGPRTETPTAIAALASAGALASLLVVAYPIGAAILEGVRASDGAVGPAPDPALLARTLAWAGAIGLLATLWACPLAWAIRPGRWWMLALVLAALLMPPYLAYAGWGMARAPGTMLGDWLARQGQGPRPWLPMAVGRGLAVLGLSLWAAPLAMLALLPRVLAIDQHVLDASRLDPMGSIRRRWLEARLSGAGLLAACGLVTLVMLGSAIPLHVAQVETWAVVVWRAMDESGAAGRARAWGAAGPVLAAGLLGAALLSRALMRRRDDTLPPLPVAGPGPSRWLACLIVAAAVGAPLAIMALGLRRAESLARFWTVSRDDVASSLAVAAMTALAAAAITLCAWAGLSARSRSVRAAAGASLAIWLIGALVPGVLVGAAIHRAWSWCPALADGPLILVLAHLARFGAAAAAAGAWMALAEPRECRDMRRLDGAEGLRGWWGAAVAGRAAVIPATGVAVGLLSLHEIEASIFVQPPGVGSLARTVLALLHFNRSEELSAAGVWIVGGGLLIALAVAAAAARRLFVIDHSRRNPPGGQPV